MRQNDFWRPSGRFIILSLFFIIFIFSCSRKKSNNSYEKISQLSNKSILDDALLKEAKHSDIPVPIGYRFADLQKVESGEDKKTDFLCYLGDLPIEQVIDYYCKNMERCGWQIADFSSEQEGLLFCNKVNKDCIISIRQKMDICKCNVKKSCVCLFIKNKLHEKDRIEDINAKKLPIMNFAS